LIFLLNAILWSEFFIIAMKYSTKFIFLIAGLTRAIEQIFRHPELGRISLIFGFRNCRERKFLRPCELGGIPFEELNLDGSLLDKGLL